MYISWNTHVQISSKQFEHNNDKHESFSVISCQHKLYFVHMYIICRNQILEIQTYRCF